MVAADRDRGAQALIGVAGRHPHVHHGDVRLVLVHRGPQRLGVAAGGGHPVGTARHDLHPAPPARPDHRGVLGDDDPHRRALRLCQACVGSSTVTTVGPPDGLLISILPSTVPIRSASPARPPRASMRAPPAPSSLTRTRSSPGTWTASSVACRAPLCLATLASSSAAQK